MRPDRSPQEAPAPCGRGRSHAERGFTLLEVLVAFVIAALALGVMFDSVLGGLRATQTASRYQEALSLARSHIASVAIADLAGREMEGDDGRGFRWKMRIKPAGTVTVARGPGDDPAEGAAQQATLYAISVTVSWKGDGAERQVKLDTARLAAGAAKGG
jgi:general secretion pathway protein I